MTEPRLADHVVMAYGSEVIHAARDLKAGPRWHALACNGRAIAGSAWNDTPAKITCKACKRALNTGKARWTGMTDDTTA